MTGKFEVDAPILTREEAKIAVAVIEAHVRIAYTDVPKTRDLILSITDKLRRYANAGPLRWG